MNNDEKIVLEETIIQLTEKLKKQDENFAKETDLKENFIYDQKKEIDTLKMQFNVYQDNINNLLAKIKAIEKDSLMVSDLLDKQKLETEKKAFRIMQLEAKLTVYHDIVESLIKELRGDK